MPHCNPKKMANEWKSIDIQFLNLRLGFPSGSDKKESACNVGDPCPIPGLARSPGKRNGYPLEYSSLEKEMVIHPSILTWEIPRNEEPGSLQSMGLQRAGHSLATKRQQHGALQSCVSFCCPPEWTRCAYTHIPAFLGFLSLWVTTIPWAASPVLYGASLLAQRVKNLPAV